MIFCTAGDVYADYLTDIYNIKIKDNIILKQVDEYKIREGTSQKDTSVKALKTKRLGKNPGDSRWLSPEPSPTSNGKEGENRVKIENKTNSENHPSHIELGLKKPMSEYTLKDNPQLCEE